MSNDEKYMKLCFELARQGAGKVSPNPLVGAVIVKDGKVISTGFHEKYGQAHAEVNAIDSALVNISGSTLYCNLEPCVHENKKTPPCVPKIISNKIKRMVIANTDPNPQVKGKGIKKLIENGIEVITGVLEDEGNELNKFFFHFMKTGLPYVSVKIASSSDGKIAKSGKEKTWLTGLASKKYVHQLRSVYDAVLIGANTVNVDDPELTVRECLGRNPVRIILDGNLNSNLEANIFKDKKSRTIIFCSTLISDQKKQKYLERNIELIEVEPNEKNKLELESVLLKLAELKIISVLVEGGAEIFSQFINQNLADEILILTSPMILEKGIDLISPENYDNILVRTEMVGEDSLSIFKRKELECSPV